MSNGDSPPSNPSGRSTTRVSGPSRGGATVHVKYRTKITSIQLTKLTYRTDHHLMTDNHIDWLNTGSLFAKPEWTLGDSCNPVSHTKSQPIAVDLEFAVEPANADETIADVIGDAPLKQGLNNHLYYTFAATNKKFKGGTVTVPATLRTTPPDQVEILSGDIAWSVKTRDDGPFDAGSSTGHLLYFTMNTPVSAPGREAGITEKRVRRSVTLVGQATPDDPHAIAHYLQNLFTGYTLASNPNVPSKFHHPRYFAHTVDGEVESGAGAWPACDYLVETAECQAIIRFVRAAMMQVGCPGVMAVVVVWADPNNHAKVMEGNWGEGLGLGSVNKTVNGKRWEAALLDREVEEGEVLDPDGRVGFNNFEACLKLTYGGKTMYYGGGSGDYSTKEKVISGSFHSLSWYSVITTPDGQVRNRIEKIVKNYKES
jgi:hypothetical protein